MTSTTNKTPRFDVDTKKWARTELSLIIIQAYNGWRLRLTFNAKAREPALTVASLTDDLDQHVTPIDYRCSPRRWRTSMVRSLCESMVHRGELICSIGLGDRGEARCYEPGR